MPVQRIQPLLEEVIHTRDVLRRHHSVLQLVGGAGDMHTIRIAAIMHSRWHPPTSDMDQGLHKKSEWYVYSSHC